MVVGAFPMAKLSVLLIKQISKPIANICKERAKNSPFFRTYVCMPPAQFYNWCEVKAKMWILNLGRPVNIPVLSQEMAIELGANLLGETVIFLIGAGLLIVEYNRQSKKEAAKEQKKVEEMAHITSTITDLYFTVQRQQTQLREMERLVLSISGKKPSPPPELPGGGKSTEPLQSMRPVNVPNFKDLHNSKNNAPTEKTYSDHDITPYPNKGIILQSLNFIQMDAFSSAFFNNYIKNNVDESVLESEKDEQPSESDKRNPAILTETLHNIENNFRSLF